MTQANIDLCLHQEEFADVDFSDMIKRPYVIFAEWKPLMVRLTIVKAFPDARHAGNAKWPQAKDVGGTHVVDIGRNPAAVVELPEMRARLVIASNEDCEVRRSASARIVLRKVAQMAIFDRARHDGQVGSIADRLSAVSRRSGRREHRAQSTHLEVAADNEDIYAVPAAGLAGLGDGSINGIERAMALGELLAGEKHKKGERVEILTQPSTATLTP